MARLTVNNQPVEFKLEADTPLLWALRDAANLTGTKYGCGTGECGACMVIVDGQAMPSCTLSLGEAEGRNVITIEGLSPDRNHPVQQAFVAEQAIQCGFCTPGLVMAAAALLARNASPTEDDIRNGITNICRCGVYPGWCARSSVPGASCAAKSRHSRPRPRLPPLPDFEDLKDRR
jgi:isoquinoline 1-oxidoreductase alpha subunit